MKTGIYCLTFKDGSKYIGKSIDLERRWQEHAESMRLGKAARPIQVAYEKHGYPSAAVVMECHSDHIDLMETYYIGKVQPSLNTMGGIYVEGSDLEILEKHSSLLEYSTAQHIAEIVTAKNRLKEAAEVFTNEVSTWKKKATEVEKFLDEKSPAWKKLKELEDENYEMYALCAEQEARLKAPWWKRIFNKW